MGVAVGVNVRVGVLVVVGAGVTDVVTATPSTGASDPDTEAVVDGVVVEDTDDVADEDDDIEGVRVWDVEGPGVIRVITAGAVEFEVTLVAGSAHAIPSALEGAVFENNAARRDAIKSCANTTCPDGEGVLVLLCVPEEDKVAVAVTEPDAPCVTLLVATGDVLGGTNVPLGLTVADAVTE